MTGITVTVVGSNSGVLGRSGSGGLGGAAAGFGSSFFFGAIVDNCQERKRGANSRGGSSKLLVECWPLYPPSTGISTPSAAANQMANNRKETIKGYAFVLLFKTMAIVCVCVCICRIRYHTTLLAELPGMRFTVTSLFWSDNPLTPFPAISWSADLHWSGLKCWEWKWWLLLKRGVDNVVQFTEPEVGARWSTGDCLSILDVDGKYYFSETIHPPQPNQAIICTLSADF